MCVFTHGFTIFCRFLPEVREFLPPGEAPADEGQQIRLGAPLPCPGGRHGRHSTLVVHHHFRLLL